METNNSRIQFTDSTKKQIAFFSNKFFLVAIGIIFIISGLFYSLIVHPTRICAENANKEANQLFELKQKTNLTLPIPDKKKTEMIFFERCLESNGINSSNAMFANTMSLFVGLGIEFTIIFLYLFLFSNQYESGTIKVYRAIALSTLLVLIGAIGNALGFIALIIAAILNLVAIMFILGYSFSGAFLFLIGLNLVSYSVFFLVSSILK